ncbi:hypothetical protein NA57DRAFT_78410 [Rhizodiscina lignyota]|uniref:C2H2-type domain-containing protein n=1 Tax=Rhizodiscina lignyota TaxID=1504668 RepID=A0A9P4M8H3_9PEZI|nr:hypothetical protein NA57DRAFT_78410 [Rhizodiscina lignyota]
MSPYLSPLWLSACADIVRKVAQLPPFTGDDQYGTPFQRYMNHDEGFLSRYYRQVAPQANTSSANEEDVAETSSRRTGPKSVTSSNQFLESEGRGTASHASAARDPEYTHAPYNWIADNESLGSDPPPPGLAASLRSLSLDSEPNTSLALHLPQNLGWDVAVEHNGTTRIRDEVPADAKLPCPFSFLKCDDSFDNADSWVIHSLSHFNCQPPPKCVSCPLSFCQHLINWRDDDRSKAWNKLMGHLLLHHQQGHNLAQTSKERNQHLFKRLFDVGAIGHAELQDLKSRGELNTKPRLQKSKESKRHYDRSRRSK